MPKLITKIDRKIAAKNAARCKQRGIILPTIKQQMYPETIPQEIKDRLKPIGLWDINPLNLFRITWKNNIETGLFGAPNFLEIPPEISGVKARIIGLVGKYFPTGAHKVGAAYGCLAPILVSGSFDPEIHKAVWPSTGNYCRGGAFDCALLACPAVAILPEEMSKERFDWLHEIGAEVYATPGCESNVKEIFDKCAELRPDPQYVILNQFDEFGNSFWHYHLTGNAIEEVYDMIKRPKNRLSGYVSATGSAGTIAAGDYLKRIHPLMKTTAAEAFECPTLLNNGFGGHRIEGIGDKHVPWIHNVRHTDAVAAIRDEDCMRLLRLFNEEEGKKSLIAQGVSESVVNDLPLLGISSIGNLLACIKMAKYFEYNEDDVIFTCFTDSAEMYESRIAEQNADKGAYSELQAALDLEGCIRAQSYDNFLELSYQDQKRIHNLKYYTWVEQQGKTYEEILKQWEPEYWTETFEDNLDELDKAIEEFNAL
ncbi:MAG: pyridoxal-phosphate dependent enzyme [Candidatus Cloacimonetes bacterium]|jgi:cysteine synthase|nr:pyridoxal-phosphate dependent enzyme [Candidatus Cloacimonadota bacterium]MDY0298960.1 pyridoxal-phosphate dependent enzyme [Candidatus Cloacimonadaceae bacterium]MCB5280048.1 pyridoxal-phosphate dependent enzyme [Candidatus Cloacimonadota bacterium]MCK9332307.1 pyridoxal-phosphate dependent enzyme [Candidatus Cloacimonadota bacterium]MDD2210325.1 pyridoxal-phosphate dependent enzyme [Candidatus Cloacimonadota bacterium]